MVFEYAVKYRIERKYFSVIDVISDLPAYRSFRMKKADSFCDRRSLAFDVKIKRGSLLILLTDIIGRRSDYQIHAAIFQRAHKI